MLNNFFNKLSHIEVIFALLFHLYYFIQTEMNAFSKASYFVPVRESTVDLLGLFWIEDA